MQVAAANSGMNGFGHMGGRLSEVIGYRALFLLIACAACGSAILRAFRPTQSFGQLSVGKQGLVTQSTSHPSRKAEVKCCDTRMLERTNGNNGANQFSSLLSFLVAKR